MKLIYAAVFAFFPLAASAQTLDSSLLSALCNDDYTVGQCSAGEVLSVEAILEKYSAVVKPDTGDDLADFLVPNPDDVPVGSINPRIETAPVEPAILTLPDDKEKIWRSGWSAAALLELELTRTSPGAETLAKSIIAIATQGERDPNRLRERAIERIWGLPEAPCSTQSGNSPP